MVSFSHIYSPCKCFLLENPWSSFAYVLLVPSFSYCLVKNSLYILDESFIIGIWYMIYILYNIACIFYILWNVIANISFWNFLFMSRSYKFYHRSIYQSFLWLVPFIFSLNNPYLLHDNILHYCLKVLLLLNSYEA